MRCGHAALVWEHGGASGHARRLDNIARALTLRGWRVTLVEPEDAFVRLHEHANEVLQVPSPRPFQRSHLVAHPAATHADILDRIGLGNPRFVVQRILLWRRMLDRIRPDVVVSDMAPCLNLVCRERLPWVPVGNACLLPPGELHDYPILRRSDATVDQSLFLDDLNGALDHVRAPALDRLSAIYDGASQGCIALDLLDPYASTRSIPTLPPPSPPPGPAGGGDAVVAYLSAMPSHTAQACVEGLAAAGYPTLAIIPFFPELAAKARDAGLEVTETQLSASDIARRARVGFSAATPGFVSTMAWLGRPQAVVGTDYERNINAALLKRHGLAARVEPLEARNPNAIASAVERAWSDPSLVKRAQAVAAELAAMPTVDPFEALADRIEAI